MLPQEIMVNIISRLPAKSIGRFRCVSKLWRSLLSHTDFTKMHFDQYLPTEEESLIIASGTSDCLYSIQLKNEPQLFDEMSAFATPLKFHAHHSSSFNLKVDSTASCDGFILFRNGKNELVLLNPTTREIQILPTSPFALDPCVSHILYGIGYDCVSDDYKVVTLSYYDAYYYEDYDENDPDCAGIYVNVYSHKNGTWKKAGSSPYDHAVGYPASGVFVNGCIHWLASKGVHHSVIAAFNLGNEEFYEVPPPCLVDCGNFVFDRLVVLGGCLCMFSSPRKDVSDHVWMMKEYGVQESWTKLRICDTEELEFRPLCLLGMEQMVLLMDLDLDLDLDSYAERLVMCNLNDRTCEDISVHGIPDGFCVGGVFVESLVSPRYIRGNA